MDHEDAVRLFHGSRRGKLTSRQQADLSAHLAECEECRTLGRVYGVLHIALQAEQAAAEHPSTEEIVAFATHSDSIDERAASRVANHLRSCPSCSSEVEATRESHESITAGGTTSSGRRESTRIWLGHPSKIMAVAASVLVAVLVYPAYLGLVRKPALDRRLAQLEQDGAQLDRQVGKLQTMLDTTAGELERLRRWGAGVRLNLVSGGTRGEATRNTFVIRADQLYVAFGLDFELVPGLDEDSEVRFRIESEGGAAVRTIQRPVGEVQSDFREAGVVTLLVPRVELPDGAYRIEVSAGEGADGPRLLLAEFEVSSG
jgi:hypothetical protein